MTAWRKNGYNDRKVSVETDEIFISDGAKCDIANILDVFDISDVLIPSPVYPVYADVNLMKGNRINFLELNEECGFIPCPETVDKKAYIIYICSPNNPTGIGYSASILKCWVDFALETGSVIVFDGAYSEYITGDEPHSVYEIYGAKECSIEVCSLSKRAGFTGVRCGWSVVPKAIRVGGESLNALWQRRQSTKFNGVGYPVQVAACAALSEKGRFECKKQIKYYLDNAKLITKLCENKGITYFGGVSSPYVWMKCPNGYRSWKFFDYLLERAGIVATPGVGFGKGGEGYMRLTGFNTQEKTAEAVQRLYDIL